MEQIEGYGTWLEIDLDAIGHNLTQIREATGGEVVPCLKSNAYGHGLTPLAAYLQEQGVRNILVAKLHEALQVREAGLDIGVVSIDPLFSEAAFKTIVKNKITQTVYQLPPAKKLNETASQLSCKTPVWVKVDTGLGRVGVRWTEAPEYIKEVSSLPHLDLRGVFSTLSEDEELDRLQVERLKGVVEKCHEMGVDTGTVSIASSNAIIHKPYAHLQATRPGLMLMGIYPERTDMGQGIELQQSLTWKARIEHVKNVEPGESLTYSKRFTATKPTTVGTIHVGYYDGYPRGLTSKGKVWAGGELRDVLGTVSVNHHLVDLTGLDLQVGDTVELVSPKPGVTALEVAERAGIMTYSLANALHILLPRVYYRGGRPIALLEPPLNPTPNTTTL